MQYIDPHELFSGTPAKRLVFQGFLNAVRRGAVHIFHWFHRIGA
jgi:hypothetical protein